MWTLHEGDCLDVMRSMPDGSVDAVITDPPYGIAFQSARRTEPAERHDIIANDEAPFVDWIPDAYRVLRDGGSIVCFYRWDVQEAFKSALEDAGFSLKSQIVWHKGGGGIGDLKASFAPEHELALFAVKGSFEFRNGRPMSVVRVPRIPAEKLTHPAEKPVALMEHLIRKLTVEGETVLEPFAGSGAVIEACERLGRKCIAAELDPKHASTVRKRLGVIQPSLL